MRQLTTIALLALLAGCESLLGTPEDNPPEPEIKGLHGALKDAEGNAMAGRMVTAKAANGIETTVFTGADGGFHIEGLADGAYEVTAHYPGMAPSTASATLAEGTIAEAMAMTGAEGDRTNDVPTSAWLALMPDGHERREFILNCGTCHGVTSIRIEPEGTARDAEGWTGVIAAMRAMDVYKVIPPDFEDATYGAWLAEHLSAEKLANVKAPAPMDPAQVGNVVITEFPIPHQETELPHDLVIGPNGKIWVTGFWTGEMWALDPATGEYETYDVYPDRDEKVPAQTRALEFDSDGILWMINGGTSAVVSLNPETKEVKSFDAGMYAHDIVLDSNGEAWFNDYFTRKDPRIGHLKADGTVEVFDLPGKDTPESEGVPLPYGLMIDKQDRLFSTQLAGNTLVRYDIGSGESKLYEMPEANVGPRRTALHPDGSLWIPEYNTGRITRFDPESETFETIPLGVPTAGPYDADINMKTGEVWVSGSLDTSLFRVDPASKSVMRIQLPTEPALIRHMATDENTGEVWVAYSSLPTAVPKVARISMKAAPAAEAPAEE